MRTIVSIMQANLRLLIILLSIALLIAIHHISKTPESEKELVEPEAIPAISEGAEKEHEIASASAETQQPLEEVSTDAELSFSPLEEVKTATETLPAPSEELAEPIVEAYCVKCRQKRTMFQPQQSRTKNGRNAMTGTCPVCGTRLFRFI